MNNHPNRRAVSASSRGVPVSALLLLLAAAALGGCRTERMVRRSKPEPAWRSWGETVAGGRRKYVGVAVAENILDEERARRRAMMNAAASVAASVEVAVLRQAPEVTAEEWRDGGYPSELLGEVRQRVRGLRAEDWYYEKWRVRERALGPLVTRYKVFVLADFPEEEYQRLLSKALASLERDLPYYSTRVHQALLENRPLEAAARAEEATLRFPDERQAWWTLYLARQANRDWAGAVDALRRAEALARTPERRRAVQDALGDARDQAARAALAEAEALNAAGRRMEALGKFAEAWGATSEPGLRARAAAAYRETMTDHAAEALAREASARGMARVDMGSVIAGPGHSGAETEALRASLARKLRERGLGAALRALDADTAEKMMAGDWGALPAPSAEESGGVALARVGASFETLLADLSKRETVSVGGARALGSVRGRGDLAVWSDLERLIPPNPGASFAASVWTDRTRYRRGDPLRIHFKTSVDCHVYLVNLATSGGASLLFPGGGRESGVRGGVEYTIPDSDRYGLRAEGPPGWEGLRLIASRARLDLDLPESASGAVGSARERAVVERLGAALRELPADQWAEAVWTFYIR